MWRDLIRLLKAMGLVSTDDGGKRAQSGKRAQDGDGSKRAQDGDGQGRVSNESAAYMIEREERAEALGYRKCQAEVWDVVRKLWPGVVYSVGAETGAPMEYVKSQVVALMKSNNDLRDQLEYARARTNVTLVRGLYQLCVARGPVPTEVQAEVELFLNGGGSWSGKRPAVIRTPEEIQRQLQKAGIEKQQQFCAWMVGLSTKSPFEQDELDGEAAHQPIEWFGPGDQE